MPGTLTLSFELGKAVRLAREAGQDPIAAAARMLEGWVLFSGEVIEKEWEDKQGLMAGTTHIRGLGHLLDTAWTSGF